MNLSFEIRALTPIFSYGADPYAKSGKGQNQVTHPGTPEIRASSIRGQLRWWMELLGYQQNLEPIFGSAADNDGKASKVIVRISNIRGQIGERKCTQQHHWSKKTCYLPGTQFTLHVIERLGGLNEHLRKSLVGTIDAWLMMGTLGGRGTRAAGSLEATQSVLPEMEWAQRCKTFLANSNARLFLGRTAFESEEAARYVICDTLKEEAFHGMQPLGGIHPRKTSPLRMRVVRFADADPARPYRIAALWTEANVDPLEKAIRTLKKGNPRGDGPKPIGDELANAIIIK